MIATIRVIKVNRIRIKVPKYDSILMKVVQNLCKLSNPSFDKVLGDLCFLVIFVLDILWQASSAHLIKHNIKIVLRLEMIEHSRQVRVVETPPKIN